VYREYYTVQNDNREKHPKNTCFIKVDIWICFVFFCTGLHCYNICCNRTRWCSLFIVI